MATPRGVMTTVMPRDARRTAGTDLALLLLRLVLAVVFGAYGYAKWAGGMGQLAGLLMAVHLPLPDLTARAVAALELGGAVLLVLGIATRAVGALLALEMTVAIGTVVWPHGLVGGFAFELTLLTVALALAIAGGGAFSLGRGPFSR
jgi:putative oxidoreductase